MPSLANTRYPREVTAFQAKRPPEYQSLRQLSVSPRRQTAPSVKEKAPPGGGAFGIHGRSETGREPLAAALDSFGEPDCDFASCRLVGVGAMNHVESNFKSEVATNRAGGGLDRIGGADQLASGLHGLGTLQHCRDQRTTGDEIDQFAEKGLLGVFGVVLVGYCLGSCELLESCNPQSLALESDQNLASERAFKCVRLYQDQGL